MAPSCLLIDGKKSLFLMKNNISTSSHTNTEQAPGSLMGKGQHTSDLTKACIIKHDYKKNKHERQIMVSA